MAPSERSQSTARVGLYIDRSGRHRRFQSQAIHNYQIDSKSLGAAMASGEASRQSAEENLATVLQEKKQPTIGSESEGAVMGKTAAPAAGNGKHRLSDDCLSWILKREREPLLGAEDRSFLRTNNPVKFPGWSEEMVEQTSKQYKEDEVLFQEMEDRFMVFQAWAREELVEKGYVEVDDEYLAAAAEEEAEGKAEWAQREHFPGAKIADLDDPDYADFCY